MCEMWVVMNLKNNVNIHVYKYIFIWKSLLRNGIRKTVVPWHKHLQSNHAAQSRCKTTYHRECVSYIGSHMHLCLFGLIIMKGHCGGEGTYSTVLYCTSSFSPRHASKPKKEDFSLDFLNCLYFGWSPSVVSVWWKFVCLQRSLATLNECDRVRCMLCDDPDVL
jgi:hypothetical protein